MGASPVHGFPEQTGWKRNQMFEFLDKVWLAWTGWDIIQAYVFGAIIFIVLFLIFGIIAASLSR